MAIESGNRSALARQRGAVAILVALLLGVLIAFAAFAIDVGRWLVVRNELQNGADAASLAGAGYLYPPVSGRPNWAEAVNQGQSAVSLNASENVALSTGDVTPGWWDFRNRSFDPDTTKSPTVDDLPALRVGITRTAGRNAGPVMMTFARVLGVDRLDSSASATAVVSVPASAGVGALAPIAISECLLDGASPPLWDKANSKPIGSPPIKFVIASGAANGTHCNGCACGQWTTFDTVSNNVPTVRSLLQGGNPTSLAIGDNTYIQPGVEATLYDTADARLTGTDIVVPVVADDELGKKGFTPILAWSCLRVFDVIKTAGTCETFNGEGPLPGGVDDKGKPIDKTCLVVSFSPDPCKMPGAEGGGSGPFTGAYVPPRLVQ